MESASSATSQQINRAKLWEILLFTFNNTSCNIYLFVFGFVTYYSTGIVGLSVILISSILGFIRFFDGAIDPFLGVFIDKLNTRFGKFRPLIVLGNILLALSIVLMFSTHNLPQGWRLVFLIMAFVIHKIGYSLQGTVTKAGQTVLTNDTKQRPLYAIFDGIYNIILFTGGQMFVSNYLIKKYGDFTLDFFFELATWGIAISAFLALLAIIGIWNKDREENFGLGEQTVAISGFKDYWKIIKNNRPLQMLTIAASVNKLSVQMMRDSVVVVMLFGILIGNYELSGTMSGITAIPTLLIVLFSTWLARRKGMKSSLTTSLWITLASYIGIGSFFIMSNDPSMISADGMNLTKILFIILYTFIAGFSGIPSSLVTPMVADVSDYETEKSGFYAAGMISTLFSFIDSLVSSLSPFIIGLILATLGYSDSYPSVGDALTTPLFTAIVLLISVIPAILVIVSLLAMKFYTLDMNAMHEIEKSIVEQRAVTTDS